MAIPLPSPSQIARMRQQRRATYGLINPDANGGGGGASGLLFQTIAEAEALFSVQSTAATRIYVVQPDAEYRWDPTSSIAVDHYRVLAAGVMPGRLILTGTTFTMQPRGFAGINRLDDSPALTAALSALSGYATLGLASGAYYLTTVVPLRSGSRLAMLPNVLLDAVGEVFSATSQGTDSGSLTTDVAVGSEEIEVTALVNPPPVGIGVTLQRADTNMSYVAQAVVVTGPGVWRVTLDRPVDLPFDAATTIVQLAQLVQNVQIDGNGADISSTSAPNGMLFANVIGIELLNLTITARRGLPVAAGIDLDGCYRGRVEGCVVDLPGYVGNGPGIQFEGCEAIIGRKNVVRHTRYGQVMSDCLRCGIEDPETSGCNPGVLVTTLDAVGKNFGCVDCWVIQGGDGGGSGGIVVQGSTRTVVRGWSSIGATGTGILVAPGPNNNGFGSVDTIDTTIADCAATSCQRGLAVLAGVIGTKVSGLDVSRCTQRAIFTESDLDAQDVTARGLSTDLVQAVEATGTVGRLRFTRLLVESTGSRGLACVSLAGAEHTLSDCEIDVTARGSVAVQCGGVTRIRGGRTTIDPANSSGPIALQAAGSLLDIDQHEIKLRNVGIFNAYAIDAAGGVTQLRATQILAGGTGKGVILKVGATLRTDSRVTNDAAIPLDDLGGHSNRGTWVAGAGAVAWPDLNENDAVILTRIVDGGSFGPMPSVAQVPAVGFTPTAVAGDTSTYSYVIQ